MPRITIYPSEETFEYNTGLSLLEILRAQKYFVDNPCNGKAVCGKCRVKIVSENEFEPGIYHSCLVKPTEDMVVELLKTERKQEVLTEGYVPKFEFDTGIKKLGECYGVVIDIGTTTVVCALVDMLNGKELSNASRVNAQKRYGLDVLTRITYEIEHPETGVDDLQKAIVVSINEMIDECCKKANIEKKDICEIFVSANCTMMHTLLGVDATPIGKSPYIPIFTEAKNIRASEIGIEGVEDAKLYCLPSVSAYIGADIVAGAYVCELHKQTGNVLFIDIGTNGEIVLSKGGELLCCSCAAGPALEGMNISCGMRAAEGAIEDVKITKSGVVLKVIGDQEPIGICGSGVLSAVKELLRVGLVQKDGAFNQKEFVLADGDEDEKIVITQKDIRQVQLTKGAILSGFITLLNKAGITMKDLDKVMIAGQFGTYLSVESLIGTGILPEEVREKVIYVGNTSKTGAYMALMSKKVKSEIEELVNHMEYIELGMTENYERVFCSCLNFP